MRVFLRDKQNCCPGNNKVSRNAIVCEISLIVYLQTRVGVSSNRKNSGSTAPAKSEIVIIFIQTSHVAKGNTLHHRVNVA